LKAESEEKDPDIVRICHAVEQKKKAYDGIAAIINFHMTWIDENKKIPSKNRNKTEIIIKD
jgi:hypothetical protein